MVSSYLHVLLVITSFALSWAGIRNRVDRATSSAGTAAPADPNEPIFKGGSRKRSLAALGSSPSQPEAQPFTHSLKRDWAKGLLSSRQVQEYAWTAQQQGATGVDKIAASGPPGAHPSSIHRSLRALFGNPKGKACANALFLMKWSQ